MYVIRPIRADDIDYLEDIAMSATLGLTSLPKNRKKLEDKLENVLKSFKKTVTEPKDELYLFVLENTKDKAIGGTAGITAKIGVLEPVHFFSVQLERAKESEQVSKLEILKPISYINGPSEIGSLFLKKEFRHEGLGKLLSFCRFLFIADHLNRFDDTIVAEMRGVINKGLNSPLWNALGMHFFNASFKEAMMLRDQGLFNLNDVIPENPIYISLLSKSAQKVIGKVHQNTKGALKMLIKQGFTLTNEIDLFDGGPKIEAKTQEIKAITKSKTARIGKIEDIEEKGLYVISNRKIDFRACLGSVKWQKNGDIILSKEVAKTLLVEVGNSVRYYKI